MLSQQERGSAATAIELARAQDGSPVLVGTGLLDGAGSGLPLLPHGPGLPLLGEHARGRFTRPHLRGQRAGGRDWSTRFDCSSFEEADGVLRIELEDKTAGL